MTPKSISPHVPQQANGSGEMLLYAVAALRVEPSSTPHWFQRCSTAHAVVISHVEDVADILLRLPDEWNLVEHARCRGLHDNLDILAADIRFNQGFDESACAIVAHNDGTQHVLLMQINSAEVILLPERLFEKHARFEHSIE